MEYRWGLLVVMVLAACKEEPKGPFQIQEPESMRFDTERIRREVDIYKTEQSPVAKRRMEKAFAAFDERLRTMETETGVLVDPAERELAERRVANMKMRRDLHWTRSQTRYEETEIVKRAVPISEREAVAAESGASEVRRAEPISDSVEPEVVAEQTEAPKRPSTVRARRGSRNARDVEVRPSPRTGLFGWKLFAPRGGSTPPQRPMRIPAR